MSGLLGGQTQGSTEPRLGSLTIQTSVYGMCIPLIYGRQRVPPNLIWYGDFKSTAIKQAVGGKGGSQSSTSYNYKTALMLSICEGPIERIGDIWKSKTKLTTTTDSHGTVLSPLAQLNLTEFTGTVSQAPWDYLTTKHPSEALSYANTAYVASGSYDLGNSASLPNHNFEVHGLLRFGGDVVDASPAAVIYDFLTNPQYGAGFPAAKIASMTQFNNYVVAAGLFVSPAYTSQQAAQQSVDDMLSAVNCAAVNSGGQLRIIPYGDASITGHGASFTPNLTPVYHLTDDDFIATDDPIRVTRTRDADAFNRVQIEFLDRNNQYNVAIAEAKDQANIELYGLRTESPQQCHMICDAAIAAQVAQLRLQRLVYIRNQYEFSLSWKHCLLEPMDIVTLTDEGLGLVQFPVRIKSIDENDGVLDIKAEELIIGTASALTYTSQGSGGYPGQYGNAGDVNAPFVFEPPLILTTNGKNEVWAAVSGGDNWSGCHVWAAFTPEGADPESFKQIGTIEGVARYGVLSAGISGSDLALTTTLNTAAQIYSGTTLDANAGETLCFVGGELLSYETATLAGTNQYTLSELHRGQYGTTAAGHATGASFARLDGSIFKYAYDKSLIGKTINLKFTSFNAVLGSEQSLSDVASYSYLLTGGQPEGVANLSLQAPFIGTSFKVQWSSAAGASSYTVKILASSVLIREFTTTSTEFSYSLEDAAADGGSHRAYSIEVASNSGSLVSVWSQLNISNPVPAVLTGITTNSTASNVSISFSPCLDTDFKEYAVWISTTTGFDPTTRSPDWTGSTPGTTFTGLTASTTYYLIVAARDKWGAGVLNYSSQITQATTS